MLEANISFRKKNEGECDEGREVRRLGNMGRAVAEVTRTKAEAASTRLHLPWASLGIPGRCYVANFFRDSDSLTLCGEFEVSKGNAMRRNPKEEPWLSIGRRRLMQCNRTLYSVC